MENVSFQSGEIIFKQNQASGKMYKIVSGKVAIMAEKDDGREEELAVLGAGKFFGEMGLIEKAPRSASAEARTDVQLIAIDEKSFMGFVQANTADVLDMMKNLSARLRKMTKDYTEVLKTVELYVDVSDKEKKEKKNASLWEKLNKISDTAREESQENVVTAAQKGDTYQEGEVIFKKGQKGSVMYKILSGEVGFYTGYGTAKQIELSKLGQGGIFGEMAVIEDERRSADAVALSAVKLTTVGNTQFGQFVENNPDDALKILRNLSSKLRATNKLYLEALKTIADCVADANMGVNGAVWNSFVNYSSVYSHYGADPSASSFYFDDIEM